MTDGDEKQSFQIHSPPTMNSIEIDAPPTVDVQIGGRRVIDFTCFEKMCDYRSGHIALVQLVLHLKRALADRNFSIVSFVLMAFGVSNQQVFQSCDDDAIVDEMIHFLHSAWIPKRLMPQTFRWRQNGFVTVQQMWTVCPFVDRSVFFDLFFAYVAQHGGGDEELNFGWYRIAVLLDVDEYVRRLKLLRYTVNEQAHCIYLTRCALVVSDRCPDLPNVLQMLLAKDIAWGRFIGKMMNYELRSIVRSNGSATSYAIADYCACRSEDQKNGKRTLQEAAGKESLHRCGDNNAEECTPARKKVCTERKCVNLAVGDQDDLIDKARQKQTLISVSKEATNVGKSLLTVD